MNQFSKISYLMVETNSSCNLKCTWCNRERLVAEGQRSPKNISLPEFKKLLEPFQECSIDTIKLEGISEPMLHPEFDSMAKEVRTRFPQAFVIIATNCQYNLVKTKFIQTLPYVDMVYLSVDGIGENFERHRKGASYPKLLESFRQIKENVSLAIRQKKLFINFTATEENYQDLPAIYDLSAQNDFAGVRINIVQNWNEDEANTHSFSTGFFEMIKRYKKDLKGVPGWNYKDCFWPYEGIVVDVFGNIRQCIINTSQKPLGNIHTDDIKKIYNESQVYLETRQLLRKNCAPDACKTCDYHIQSKTLQGIMGEDSHQNKARTFLDVTQG